MRKLLVVFVLLFGYIQVSAQFSYIALLAKQSHDADIQKVRVICYEAKDSLGLIVKGELKSAKVFEYNEDGLLTVMTNYQKDGSVESKQVILYDENKKIKKIKFYDGDGAFIGTLTFEYVENTPDVEQAKIRAYFPDVPLMKNVKIGGYKIVFTDRLIYEKNKLLFLNITDSRIARFDDNYNITEEYVFKSDDNSLKEINLSGYNDKGFISREKTYNSDLFLTKDVTYKDYEYDSHGEWTKRIEYKNGYPQQICERSITYR